MRQVQIIIQPVRVITEKLYRRMLNFRFALLNLKNMNVFAHEMFSVLDGSYYPNELIGHSQGLIFARPFSLLHGGRTGQNAQVGTLKGFPDENRVIAITRILKRAAELFFGIRFYSLTLVGYRDMDPNTTAIATRKLERTKEGHTKPRSFSG